MPLSRFSLTAPVIRSGVLLQALDTVMPPELISQAIRESHSQQQRQRSLPTYVVVALVIAMSLWSSDSIVDVFKNLITGLTRQWIRTSVRWKIPSSSSISEARQRVGPAVMSFGDGHHRCPGAYLALEETDIFLQRLLRVDGLQIAQKPSVTWNDLTQGYELRSFILAVR